MKLGVGVGWVKVWVPLASALGQGQHGGTAQYYYKRISKRGADSEPRRNGVSPGHSPQTTRREIKREKSPFFLREALTA